MAKDPARWNETIISTPFATLTKKDVFDYYANPAIKNKIMRSAGGGETIVRQSFSPGQDVLRRKDSAGDLIQMTSAKFDELNDQRMSEVHPTFGKKVDFLLADIDPKGKVPWQQTKAIAETIAKTMQTHPDVKKVNVQFSGNRGFYVKGMLGKQMGVDSARALTKSVLDGVARRPDVTFGVPRSGQIRIDTTPLKNRGSVKAPFSLDARTGLVAAPVPLDQLHKVKKEDFTVTKVLKDIKKKASVLYKKAVISEEGGKFVLRSRDEGKVLGTHPTREAALAQERAIQLSKARRKVAELLPEKNLLKREKDMTGPTGVTEEPTNKEWVFSLDAEQAPYPPIVLNPDKDEKWQEVKKAAEEFAPGIPMSRTIKPVPVVENQPWMMTIQRHHAHQAGKHYDLRLVDPETDEAHSFAVPKARLPRRSDRMLLALQQPTHTADYALNFEGEIPKGTYGAGKVTMPFKEQVSVIKSNADKIHFQRANGQKFVLFRTGSEGPSWGFKRLK